MHTPIKFIHRFTNPCILFDDVIDVGWSIVAVSTEFYWQVPVGFYGRYRRHNFKNIKKTTKCLLYQEILQLIQHFQKVKNQHGIIFSHGGQYFPGLHDCDYLLHIKKLIKLCYIRSSEIWRGLDEQYNF